MITTLRNRRLFCRGAALTLLAGAMSAGLSTNTTYAADDFPPRHSMINPKSPRLDAVGDQGSEGSCVAWSTCGAIGTVFMRDWYTVNVSGAAKIEAFMDRGVNLLDARAFYRQRDAAYIKSITTKKNPKGEGWHFQRALKKATTYTIPFKHNPNYGLRITAGRASAVYNKARRRVGTRYGGYQEITDRDEMRKELSLGRPLLARFDVFDNFQPDVKKRGIYLGPPSGKDIGGHAVMTVGYQKIQPGRAGVTYWECQNSWGRQFGKNGYFLMKEGVCGIDASMWVVYNVGMYDKKGRRLSLAEQNREMKKALQPLSFVKIEHKGGYVADFSVYYEAPKKIGKKTVWLPTVLPWTNATAGQSKKFNLPLEARNIKVFGDAYVFIGVKKPIFRKSYKDIPAVTLTATGTTLNRTHSEKYGVR